MARHTAILGALLTSVAEGIPDLTDRLPGALTATKEAQGTLGAVDTSKIGSAPTNTISDPTGDAATTNSSARDEGRHARRRIEALVRDLADNYRQLVIAIDDWNPGPELQAGFRDARDITNETVWCENHLDYGQREPRRPGSRNCGWCDKVKSKYKGRLPGRALIDAHHRSNRLTDTDYRRLLALDHPATTNAATA